MKRVSRGAAATLFATLAVIFTAVCFFFPTAAYAAGDPTVYLPESRFAVFEFVSVPPSDGGKNVMISVTDLDDRLSYAEFENYFTLKTASGGAVEYEYIVISNESAQIFFTLKNESVYLKLSPALDDLPAAEYTKPTIDAEIPLTVDDASYSAAASHVQSGKISLSIVSIPENDSLLSLTAGYLDSRAYDLEYAYHFSLALERLQNSEETPSPVYFGGDGKALKIRAELPKYNPSCKYLLVSDLGAQGIRVLELRPNSANGYYTVEFEISKNGNFSIFAVRQETLPLWAILLISFGGAAIAGGIFLLIKFLPKQLGKRKSETPNPSEKTADSDQKNFEPKKTEAETLASTPNSRNSPTQKPTSEKRGAVKKQKRKR